MSYIIRNIQRGLVYIGDELLQPEIYNKELLSKIAKSIDLIEESLPREVDCFGVEDILPLKYEEWNLFNSFYIKLRFIFHILKKDRVKDMGKNIGDIVPELYDILDQIEKKVVAVVNKDRKQENEGRNTL